MLVLLSQYYRFKLTLWNTTYIYLHMHTSERKRNISFMFITCTVSRPHREGKKQVQQLFYNDIHVTFISVLSNGHSHH